LRRRHGLVQAELLQPTRPALRLRLLALTVQVEVLDLARGVLEAVALDELVVEVLLARAHAADVERDEGPHGVARPREVVGDEDLHGGRDVEAVEVASTARGALLE